MFSRALIFVVAVLPISAWPQDDQYQRVYRESQAKNYLAVLRKHGIEATASGAKDFLAGLIPNEESRQKIGEIVGRLSDKKYTERQISERQLISFGATAIPYLKSAVRNGDPETQMRAKRALDVISKHSSIITNAALNVLKFDGSKVPSTNERLETFFELCRNASATDIPQEFQSAIVFCANPRVSEKIVAGIKDSSRAVRVSCIRSLPSCFDKVGLKQFSSILESDDPYESIAAIESFGFVRPTRAVEIVVSRHLASADLAIRNSAANFLRAISTEYFEFDGNDAIEKRRLAIEKWTNWFQENRPLDESVFERMSASSNKPPTGFLISINGQGARHYDMSGKLVKKFDGVVYDSQHIDSARLLVTLRSQGKVILVSGKETKQEISGLNSPSDADYLPNGHFLIAQGSGIITEYDSSGAEVLRLDGFSNPFDVDRLSNGNTLVADSSNNRIVEVNSVGTVVWERTGLKFPNNVYRLPDGRTLYTTYTSGIVSLLGNSGNTLWETKIPSATLYSVYCAQGKVYVADGSSRKIWILDMEGEVTAEMPIQETFCDVDFVTR